MKYSDVLKITGVNEVKRREAYELLLRAIDKTSKRRIIGKIKEAPLAIGLEPDVEYLARLYNGCDNINSQVVLYKIARYFANDLLKEGNYKEYFYIES